MLCQERFPCSRCDVAYGYVVSGSAEELPAEPPPRPLLEPTDGLPEIVTTPAGVASAAAALTAGSGPLAVDAERASGFRYSQRAYLVQLRRAGAGTVLVDPIPVADEFGPLADAINGLEWVLHSADQDLPCLAELGLTPARLFDTELAGRLAGFDRVALATMVERLLGLGLTKGHGAADWSRRPLPEEWVNYAALDVEVLLELRTAIAAELESQGKTDWAAQEFEHIRTFGPPRPKTDRWRRTSGIHTLRKPAQLAAARALWTARDTLAAARDVAPGRVLPDSAIIAAATAAPRTIDELRKLPVYGGPRQRKLSRYWLDALREAAALSPRELPPLAAAVDGPPPVSRWARRNPEAAERLAAARAAMAELSEKVGIPVENLLTPDLVRRLCWAPPPGDAAAVDDFLSAGGARPWQRELAGPPLTAALSR